MINSPQRGGKFGDKYLIVREGAASRGFDWLVYNKCSGCRGWMRSIGLNPAATYD